MARHNILVLEKEPLKKSPRDFRGDFLLPLAFRHSPLVNQYLIRLALFSVRRSDEVDAVHAR